MTPKILDADLLLKIADQFGATVAVLVIGIFVVWDIRRKPPKKGDPEKTWGADAQLWMIQEIRDPIMAALDKLRGD